MSQQRQQQAATPPITRRVTPKQPLSSVTPPQPLLPPHLTKSFRKPTQVHLTPEHLQQMREIILLINHHQTIMADLDNQAKQLLLHGYQIDLDGEAWKLNLSTGVIERREA